MPYNFKTSDRDQRFLLPVDMREWLPENHSAFFVLDTVESMDLSAFYVSYREDGWGRAAFDPKMMVALILYAFSVGERSSRGIERRCVEDVGFRVIAANHTPDHSTIARFIARHYDALQGLFAQVVGVCVKAGLVRSSTVAVDGTKIAANASETNNLTEEQLADYARRVFKEVAAIDAEEDQLYGDKRGDELPPELADKNQRLDWIKQQLEQIKAQQPPSLKKRVAEREARGKTLGRPLTGDKPKSRKTKRARVNTTDPESRMMSTQKGFLQGYNAQAAMTEDQIVVAGALTNGADDCASFLPILKQAQQNLNGAGANPIGTALADAGYFSIPNLTAELEFDTLIAPVSSRRLNQAIAAYLEAGISVDPNGLDDAPDPQLRRERVRVEDEQRIKTLRRVIDGEITAKQASEELRISKTVVNRLKNRLQDQGPDAVRRTRAPKGPRIPTATQVALARLQSQDALQLYAKRATIAEPVFGQIKEARGFRKFLRRGLKGCSTEWMLMLITHNLRKVWVSTRGSLTLSYYLLLGRGFPQVGAVL